MPRYYLNIALLTRVIIDSTGKEMTGLEDAHYHAVRLVYQAQAHLPDDGESWVVQIQDESRFTREIYVPCFKARSRAKGHDKTSLTSRAHR
jgi:hypothetical protein